MWQVLGTPGAGLQLFSVFWRSLVTGTGHWLRRGEVTITTVTAALFKSLRLAAKGFLFLVSSTRTTP